MQRPSTLPREVGRACCAVQAHVQVLELALKPELAVPVSPAERRAEPVLELGPPQPRARGVGPGLIWPPTTVLTRRQRPSWGRADVCSKISVM